MSEYEIKYLPDAIYLDTNILRKSGPDLNKEWLFELKAFADDYKINLYIPELVLDEWCKFIQESLKSYKDKILSSWKFLNEYDVSAHDTENLTIELPKWETLRDIVKGKLSNIGLDIIKNWTSTSDDLIREAVRKYPPFEGGDKGLCDTIIVESIIEHASKTFKDARIIVISCDKAVINSTDRFIRKKVKVKFLQDFNIIEELKASLDSEQASYLKYREDILLGFIKTKRDEIFEFIKLSPFRFTDSWLQSYGDDRINGSVESVLSLEPKEIIKAVGGVSYSLKNKIVDRYPIDIWVQVELEILVNELNIFANLFKPRAIESPKNIDETTPLKLYNQPYWPPRNIKQTITRKIHVSASVKADRVDSGHFEDFRLEEVF